MAYVTTVGTENSAPIELYYEDHGTGQPVVLIHGYPLDGSSWEKQTQALLDAGFRVVTYDMRGWGESGAAENGYSIAVLADEATALIEHLALGEYVLIGHSMGGKVAQLVASKNPPGLAGLVLVAPATPTPSPCLPRRRPRKDAFRPPSQRRPGSRRRPRNRSPSSPQR